MNHYLLAIPWNVLKIRITAHSVIDIDYTNIFELVLHQIYHFLFSLLFVLVRK